MQVVVTGGDYTTFAVYFILYGDVGEKQGDNGIRFQERWK